MDESRCRDIVSERCGGRCERCGAPQYTCHHRWKKGQGGPWVPSNIVALCGSGTTGCHGWVEANPAAANRMGLWLRSGQHDTENQRLWLWRRWVVFHDDGTVRLWTPKPADSTAPVSK